MVNNLILRTTEKQESSECIYPYVCVCAYILGYYGDVNVSCF
jgi:hypothetical protein